MAESDGSIKRRSLPSADTTPAVTPPAAADTAPRRAVEITVSADPERAAPVVLKVNDQTGRSYVFRFTDRSEYRAFIEGQSTARIEAETNPVRKALLLQVRSMADADVIDQTGQRRSGSAVATPNPSRLTGLPVPKPKPGENRQRRGPTVPGPFSAQARPVAAAPVDAPVPSIRANTAEDMRARESAAASSGGLMLDGSDAAARLAALAGRRGIFGGDLTAVTGDYNCSDIWRKLLPGLTMSDADIATTVTAVEFKLNTILTSSDPNDILNNLKAQFGNSSQLEKLIVGARLADLLGGNNYAYSAEKNDEPTHTNPTAMLAALQQALNTSLQVPTGECGDIHTTTATVFATLGIDAGTSTVTAHGGGGHVITVLHSGGLFAIVDYGQMYVGQSLPAVLATYEQINGHVQITHLITDSNGKIIGRIETPLGAFIHGTISPGQTFAQFVQGQKLPEGSRVELVDSFGHFVGDIDSRTKIAQLLGMSLTTHVTAGSSIIQGSTVNYSVLGFGLEGKHLDVQLNVGREDLSLASGIGQRIVVGEVRAGWRGDVKVGGGDLSYGASVSYYENGGLATPGGDTQTTGEGGVYPTIGGRYAHPFGKEDGAVFVSASVTGVESGTAGSLDTKVGSAAATARSLTFANHELDMAAGVRLNISRQSLLELQAEFKNNGLEHALGLGVRYQSGRGWVAIDALQSTPNSPLGQSGPIARASVGYRITPNTSVRASLIADNVAGRAVEVAAEKVAHIDFPGAKTLPPILAQAVAATGYDPKSIHPPADGLMRGLQLSALAALQKGQYLQPAAYAALGLDVDPIGQTIAIPRWLGASVNIAGSARIRLDTFSGLNFGPALAVDIEFGKWAAQVLAIMTQVRVLAKIGTENRAVVGASVGIGPHPDVAAIHVGYEHLAPDGQKTTITASTGLTLNFNVALEKGSIIFGDENIGRRFGLDGMQMWAYRNPGVNTVDPHTGEVFAYKLAASPGQGFLDLFQYVTKPEDQKKQIRAIAERIGNLHAQGIGVFFSQQALQELHDPKKLAAFSRYLVSGDFDERHLAQARALGATDGVVFDSIFGTQGNSYDVAKGDLHIAQIPVEYLTDGPQGSGAGSSQEAARVERSKLADEWRQRGLQIAGTERLSDNELNGLNKLLEVMSRELEPGQYKSKQIDITRREAERSSGDPGVLRELADAAPGGHVAVSPHFLFGLSEANLTPSSFVIPKKATVAERKKIDRFAAFLEQNHLSVNGVARFVFLHTDPFALRGGRQRSGASRAPIFLRDGADVYIDIDNLSNGNMRGDLHELTPLVDRRATAAFESLTAESHLSPERRDLVAEWRALGLRLTGVGVLSDKELAGLKMMLEVMRATLTPAQYESKQIDVADRSALRVIGKGPGVFAQLEATAAGGRVCVSRDLLAGMNADSLAPSRIVLPKGGSVERRKLVAEWQARGLRLIGVESLDDAELAGMKKLLDFMHDNLDPAQYLFKQIDFTSGSFLRAVGEGLGFMKRLKDTEAGATISVSPHLLSGLSQANLTPSSFVIPKGATNAERKKIESFSACLGQNNMRINGIARFFFLHSDPFALRGGRQESGASRAPVFLRDGADVYVDIDNLSNANMRGELPELRQTIGSGILAAIGTLDAEATQNLRTAAMTRQAGSGTLLQYYPERPLEKVPGGSRCVYRIFDAYGRPARGADGKPLERSYEIFFPANNPAAARLIVHPDDIGQPALPAIDIDSPNTFAQAAVTYPEIGVIIDGMSGDAGHLPGVRLLHAMREALLAKVAPPKSSAATNQPVPKGR